MNLKTYMKLDAIDLAELIHKKEVKPIELIKLAFEQLAKVNPTLNAVTHHRKEKVIEEAEKIKARSRSFEPSGLFIKN